jgi:hypothetical protein
VPTVLRAGRFRVVIFLPPREREPPHVHVWSGNGEVIIDLAATDHQQTIRTTAGMRTADITAAFSLVEEHTPYLLRRWREFHG